MKKVQVLLEATQEKDPVVRALSIQFDFFPLERHLRTEGLEEVPAYYGKFKSKSRVKFSGILDAINNLAKPTREFKNWDFRGGRLETSGEIGDQKYIIELHGNYILVYKLPKE